MIKLKEKFVKRGETFTKVYESEKAYIYSRMVGKVEYFEVFKKKYGKAIGNENGKIVHLDEIREYYPCDEEFGIFAWCCRTLERAKSYLSKIEN